MTKVLLWSDHQWSIVTLTTLLSNVSGTFTPPQDYKPPVSSFRRPAIVFPDSTSQSTSLVLVSPGEPLVELAVDLRVLGLHILSIPVL